MLLSPAKTRALLLPETHQTMPFTTWEGELQSHLQTQKHWNRHFQESQEEQLKVRYLKEKSMKIRRELLGQCKDCRLWQTQPMEVSETKGNLSSAIRVDRVGIVGWTEKSLSPVKAKYAKGKADRHQEI